MKKPCGVYRFAMRPRTCLFYFCLGQYDTAWGVRPAICDGGGEHQAAELGCGRLRRCPVIRPVTDLRIYDTPYDRRRTLTAAYRGGSLPLP